MDSEAGDISNLGAWESSYSGWSLLYQEILDVSDRKRRTED